MLGSASTGNRQIWALPRLTTLTAAGNERSSLYGYFSGEYENHRPETIRINRNNHLSLPKNRSILARSEPAVVDDPNASSAIVMPIRRHSPQYDSIFSQYARCGSLGRSRFRDMSAVIMPPEPHSRKTPCRRSLASSLSHSDGPTRSGLRMPRPCCRALRDGSHSSPAYDRLFSTSNA